MCGDYRRFHFLVDLRRMGCRSDCKLPDRHGAKIWCCAWLTLMSKRRHGTSDKLSIRESTEPVSTVMKQPSNEGCHCASFFRGFPVVRGSPVLQTFSLVRRPIKVGILSQYKKAFHNCRAPGSFSMKTFLKLSRLTAACTLLQQLRVMRSLRKRSKT